MYVYICCDFFDICLFVCLPGQITDAVYKQVLSQTKTQHEALAQVCEGERPHLDSALRTDMDQIITSKEHVSGKIRGKRKTNQPSLWRLLMCHTCPYTSDVALKKQAQKHTAWFMTIKILRCFNCMCIISVVLYHQSFCCVLMIQYYR